MGRVLAGGPTREAGSAVFGAHLEGLMAQTGHELEVRHEITTDPGGPRWHGDKIDRVARVRQEFLRAAAFYDGLFMVDSDVVLGPGVLERLWAVDAPVVYGVFWTHADWGGSLADWPQVWDVHPYGWSQETADKLLAPGTNEVPVLGGGACTLIRGRGLESHYWPILDSLRPLPGMWGGEDRTYCLGLECRGIPQIAVTGLPIRHLYHLKDQTRPAVNEAKKAVGL